MLRGNTHACRSAKPAVIGSRLFSFKRNTALFCGVREYPSQVVTNSPSDITLLPFSVSGVLSGVLFTQVSTINYFIFLVICGPGLRNVILKINISTLSQIGIQRNGYGATTRGRSTSPVSTPQRYRRNITPELKLSAYLPTLDTSTLVFMRLSDPVYPYVLDIE